MILIVKLLNFIKCLWQCIKWIPDLYKYTGSCLQFASLSVVKEDNVLPASEFAFITFGYPVYSRGVLEYLILWIFIFDYKSNDVWHFSLFFFLFSLLSTSRFTCSHFFLALIKHKKYFNYFFSQHSPGYQHFACLLLITINLKAKPKLSYCFNS